jgi:hypothetical protein
MKEIKHLDELKEFFNETISTAVDKLLKDRTNNFSELILTFTPKIKLEITEVSFNNNSAILHHYKVERFSVPEIVDSYKENYGCLVKVERIEERIGKVYYKVGLYKKTCPSFAKLNKFIPNLGQFWFYEVGLHREGKDINEIGERRYLCYDENACRRLYNTLERLSNTYGKIVVTKQLNEIWNNGELGSHENFGLHMCRLVVQCYSKEMIYDKTLFVAF